MARSTTQRMILMAIGAGIVVGVVVGGIGAYLGWSAGVRGGITGALTVMAIHYVRKQIRKSADSELQDPSEAS
jgi:hypothetical protein